MKLEEQVCNLELAKELKELGVPQDSIFVWMEHKQGLCDIYLELRSTAESRYMKRGWRFISAFTVAELGEMLPDCFSSGKTNPEYWEIKKERKIFYCQDNRNYESLIFADTEADARAKMLIYLIGDKLVKVKDL